MARRKKKEEPKQTDIIKPIIKKKVEVTPIKEQVEVTPIKEQVEVAPIKEEAGRTIELAILLNSSYIIDEFTNEKIALFINGEAIDNNIFSSGGKYRGVKAEAKNGKLIVYTAKNSLHRDRTIHTGRLVIVLRK